MAHRQTLCLILPDFARIANTVISCQFQFIYWTNQVDQCLFAAQIRRIQCLKVAFFNNSMLKCFSTIQVNLRWLHLAADETEKT